ncbi:hypothetical protein [Longitalea arenae]|uniref:hypothetical protein n=1 Tax=Longitalea arenae TaxID=2812558 RepID=UPI001967464B|nr:hypothetical protein [Longitalea arenae]
MALVIWKKMAGHSPLPKKPSLNRYRGLMKSLRQPQINEPNEGGTIKKKLKEAESKIDKYDAQSAKLANAVAIIKTRLMPVL